MLAILINFNTLFGSIKPFSFFANMLYYVFIQFPAKIGVFPRLTLVFLGCYVITQVFAEAAADRVFCIRSFRRGRV